jgi:aryl-alcohol dehydrogenase-like predicted oxidoreductase
MEYRPLGRSGLLVSAFSFGAMTFGDGRGMFGSVGDTRGEEAQRQIDMCIEAGVNLFDTADLYTEGQSEELLGQTLKSRRQQVLIATKCYGKTGPSVNDLGAGRKHIVEACEASLRRLGTDYIDLYQIHNQDLLVPIEETLRALDDLVRAGKVRYVGSSNHSGWTKMRALATADRLGLARYVSQQIRYSLLDRSSENELLPMGVHEGVGAMIWGPLASGYLSGKFQKGGDLGQTRIGARGGLDALDNEHTRRALSAVEDVAQARDVSHAQVALNWVARRPGVATIIVGARTSAQLSDNLGAATWSLNDTEMEHLDKASQQPRIYPYDMHQTYQAARNPALPLQPPITPDGTGS